MSFRIFTLEIGQFVRIEEGAKIEQITLGKSITIDALSVGEEGRGRSRGILPVSSVPILPCPNRGQRNWNGYPSICVCGEEYQQIDRMIYEHPDMGKIRGKLLAANIGKSSAGAFRLETAEAPETESHAILVFKTEIGFRGGNAHTGDRSGWSCKCGAEGLQTEIACCLSCGAKLGKGAGYLFHPFPGEVLAKGTIAQGDAGAMGSGEQLIVLLPKGAVFRTKLTGNMYGYEAVRYGTFDGETVHVLTADERKLADLF